MSGPGGAGRPKAVLICFACEPGAGSEEGVGWSWAKAASEVADVTLLTTAHFAPAVRSEVDAQGLAIEVRTIDLPVWARRLFPKKLIFVYYVLWQVLAGRDIRRIEQSRTIDVVHHLTWASDSLPSALLASRAPIRIWGPVGGSTTTARGLYQYLSRRGKLDQAVRDVVNAILRRLFGVPAARRATLIAALNQDVARRFATVPTPVVTEANLSLEPHELAAGADQGGPSGSGALAPHPELLTVVFVARLIPWKGLLVAIRSMVFATRWRLVVIGEGPEREVGEALALELGVADRVDFIGRLPRDQVLGAFARVDAMLHPSFHDSAPWSVGEASALGCPVVCLDAGGPALLAGSNGHVVEVRDGSELPRRLAAELDDLPGRGLPDHRWGGERLPGLLREWYGVEAPRSEASSARATSAHEAPA